MKRVLCFATIVAQASTGKRKTGTVFCFWVSHCFSILSLTLSTAGYITPYVLQNYFFTIGIKCFQWPKLQEHLSITSLIIHFAIQNDL